MKTYIPYKLLVINEFSENEAMNKCYRLAFDWANKIGRNGKRVFDLYIQRPDPENYNPLSQQSYNLWCKIECSMREHDIWEEMQELQAKEYVLNMLKDNDEAN